MRTRIITVQLLAWLLAAPALAFAQCEELCTRVELNTRSMKEASDFLQQKVYTEEFYNSRMQELTTERQQLQRQLLQAGCDCQQNSLAPTGYCDSGLLFSESSFGEMAEEEVSVVINEILDAALRAKNFVVRPDRDIPNARAQIKKVEGVNERFIYYNPKFAKGINESTSSKWPVYCVLAHEIAHHLDGHALNRGGARHTFELQADESAGALLFKLGASLQEAQLAVMQFAPEEDTDTHPDKFKRAEAIKKGWEKAQRQQGRQDYRKYIRQADEALRDKEYAIAQEFYKKSLLAMPGDSYATQKLAEVDSQLDKNREDELFAEATRKGDALYRQGRLEEALQQFEEALRHRPSDIHAKSMKREIEEELREDETAYTSLRLMYRGDNMGCALSLRITIGGQQIQPQQNVVVLQNVPVGEVEYYITGRIDCQLPYPGFYNTYGHGTINVQPGATLYLVWQATATGQASAGFSYY